MLTRSPTAQYEQKNKIWFKHMHCKKFIGQWKHKLKDAQLFVARQPAQSWYSLAHHDIHLPWASGQVLSYTSEHDKGRQIGKFKNDIQCYRGHQSRLLHLPHLQKSQIQIHEVAQYLCLLPQSLLKTRIVECHILILTIYFVKARFHLTGKFGNCTLEISKI